MSTTEDLTVAYHQQDTDYYCGAACAQMVLDSIGAGVLNQNDLYNDNHSHSTTESGWYSGPDGVLWTMNNRKPPSPTFNGYFVLDALDHEDSISRANDRNPWRPLGWQVCRGMRPRPAPGTARAFSGNLDAASARRPRTNTGSSGGRLSLPDLSVEALPGIALAVFPLSPFHRWRPPDICAIRRRCFCQLARQLYGHMTTLTNG